MVWVGLTPMPTGTPNLSQFFFQRSAKMALRKKKVSERPPPPPPPAYQLFWELRDYGLAAVRKKHYVPPMIRFGFPLIKDTNAIQFSLSGAHVIMNVRRLMKPTGGCPMTRCSVWLFQISSRLIISAMIKTSSRSVRKVIMKTWFHDNSQVDNFHPDDTSPGKLPTRTTPY